MPKLHRVPSCVVSASEGPHIIERFLSQHSAKPCPPTKTVLGHDPAYRQRFDDAHWCESQWPAANDGAMKQRLDNSYKAATLRDNTMAERILQGPPGLPGPTDLHIKRQFSHSEQRQGTGSVACTRRAPELNIEVNQPAFFWPADKPCQSCPTIGAKVTSCKFSAASCPTLYKQRTTRRNRAMREAFKPSRTANPAIN